MPEMDGMKPWAHPRHPKFRMLPHHRAHRQGHEGRSREVPEAGASDYVAKPVNTDSCSHWCACAAPLNPLPTERVNILLVDDKPARLLSLETISMIWAEPGARRSGLAGAGLV